MLKFRRGISLIEVLVSMFVLSMGLLGVAALIPLGQYTVSETSKSDRAGACARAAKREIATRRLLQPFDAPGYDNTRWANSTGGGADYSLGMSYCIDPLLISRAPNNASRGDLASFPALNMIPSANRSSPFINNICMQRITYRGVPVNQQGTVRDPTLPYSAAERIFVWQDDLSFDFPTDRDLRPRPIVTYHNNLTQLFPAAGNLQPYLRNAEQNYSWMVTLTPARTQTRAGLGLGLADRRMYNVSVVVFYKRRLDPPSVDEEAPNERVLEVSAYQLGRGLGGGGLTLRAVRGASIRDSFAWLDFKPNDWLLLCGRYPNSQPNWPNGERYFEWYKIASAAPTPTGDAGNARRQVAVVGPDWEHTSGVTLRAVLVSNVLNVYTTTMELNLSSLWGK